MINANPDRPAFDLRRHAWRPDLAAAKLRGQCEAARFVEPEMARVRAATVPLRKRPEAGIAYETELLHGEVIEIYERKDGWLWAQAARDSYVGYLPEAAVDGDAPAATHRIGALRSFLYPGPGIKTTPRDFLPFLAEVSVIETEGDWARTADGWLYRPHLAPLDAFASDPVEVAERFLGIPYLWGGKSSLGLDCSGLVQTACFASGVFAPRDSDMQEADLGTPVALESADLAALPRGMLLFWPGHVAIAQGGGRMIHANAFHMAVESEEIVPAIARIAAKGSPLRALRRLPAAG